MSSDNFAKVSKRRKYASTAMRERESVCTFREKVHVVRP